LTAAARDGHTIVRTGTEEWPAGDRTEESLDTGGQYAVKSHRLIPNVQHATKPGQVQAEEKRLPLVET
jgi:hypothetical protein